MRFLLLACVALFAVDAQAQMRATLSTNTSGSTNARYTLTGPTTTTDISGSNGSTSIILQSDRPNAILFAASFWERGDNPCQVRARFWTAPFGFSGDSDFDPYSDDRWANCHRRARSLKRITAQFPPLSEFWGDGGAAAVHGVQVCTNNRNANNLKVKGVKFLVSMLNQDGQGRIVRSGSFAESFERFNCRKWERVRRCPQGQVATGLQVFHRGRSMTGLALKCRALNVEPM